MATRQTHEGSRTKRWLKIVSIVLILILALFAGAVWDGFSRMVTRAGAEIPLTPAYIEGLRSAGYQFTSLRVYQAVNWDNFHNEGTGLTIYQFDPREAGAVVASLEAKWPGSPWDHVVAGGAGVGEAGSFGQLVPSGWLPLDSKMLDRLKVSGRELQYYLDRDRGFLYLRSG